MIQLLLKSIGNFAVKTNKDLKMDIKQVIKEGRGTVIDVRTTEEFSGSHVVESINIPLQEIPSRVGELKGMDMPLILCCASGNRSGQATNYLSNIGIECGNAGSWLDVNYLKSL